MNRPLLFAHRGFSAQYPENTPIAFRMTAEKTAADGIESDVHLTKDGVMVIFHDYYLDRTSSGKGLIMDCTYEELLQLDLGEWMSTEFKGQKIWTLEQLLDFCKETKLLLNIELKNDMFFYPNLEEKLIDAVCTRQMQGQVLASSFNHPSMQRMKELCPEIQTGLLYSTPMLNMEEYLQWSNADCIHPPCLLLQQQPELIEVFKKGGKKINTWTVDDEKTIRKMVTLGVDGIISNRPDVLCGIAKELV